MADLHALVDRWCAENKVPCYGVDPHHKCDKTCTILGAYPRQICARSRQIHVCPGIRGCVHAVTTSEGTVCSFSGRELAGPGATALVYGEPHWGHVGAALVPVGQHLPPPDPFPSPRESCGRRPGLRRAFRRRSCGR